MATGLAARVVTRNARPARVYRAARYEATPVPTERERHVLNRLGTGFTPAAFADLRAAGGAVQWVERQLDPDSIAESAVAAAVPGWYPKLWTSAAEKWRSDRASQHRNFDYARDLSNYSLMMRVYSQRSVLESMTELWSNHFTVMSKHFPGFTCRADYDQVVRRHALGTFEDLLVAVTLHPAMLLYLDNWKSVRNAPNENHGRELLELHTVGRDSYTEAMVKDAARILSGHGLNDTVWTYRWDASRHTTGAVNLLGFSHANATADNPGLAEAFLRHLARRPETARRVATKIATRFVADSPPPAVVDRLAAAYLSSGTDIKAVIRALLESPEFWSSAGGKFRTPADDLVATCRVLRVRASAPTTDNSFAHRISFPLGSVFPHAWPRPDGPPDRAPTWATTTRMLNSWRMHWSLAGGYYPKGQVAYRKGKAFVPARSIRFDQLVDHLCRTLLGRPSTPLLLQAASVGCDVDPRATITARHVLVRHRMSRLLTVLLDTPEHMTR